MPWSPMKPRLLNLAKCSGGARLLVLLAQHRWQHLRQRAACQQDLLEVASWQKNNTYYTYISIIYYLYNRIYKYTIHTYYIFDTSACQNHNLCQSCRLPNITIETHPMILYQCSIWLRFFGISSCNCSPWPLWYVAPTVWIVSWRK